MVPTDPPSGAPDPRRDVRYDLVLGILAVAMAGAAIVSMAVEVTTGRMLLAEGFSGELLVLAAFLGVGWLITGTERRLVLHVRRIEGTHYREGYAAGYVDAMAAMRARAANTNDRPSLRPVK